ncbi:NUDIX domain-containing protein [Bacillus sp. NEB1478]|uniref:NUDIX domain-containing protein n=1 Tax=Bacillus sp. NEB1478 TaxID=3073816 RepID=UPI0028738218|nr:NUDIX domain-containing protein [Bacillus sp. NEB1478]WNB91667.1 NUDIX domain-containing protein [Bacillus sp. NEB1478]
MYKIRSSVKALIILENRLLTIEKQNNGIKKFILPGGGQEFNETLAEAVIRECKEEIGVNVKVKELIWVREFISKNHVTNQPENKETHIVEHIFKVVLEEIPEEFTPAEPDTTQTDVVWLSISALGDYNFYPRELIGRIQAKNAVGGAYIGDIN